MIGLQEQPTAVAFISPSVVLTGSISGTITAYDLSKETALATTEMHEAAIVTICPLDATSVVTHDKDGVVGIWTLNDDFTLSWHVGFSACPGGFPHTVVLSPSLIAYSASTHDNTITFATTTLGSQIGAADPDPTLVTSPPFPAECGKLMTLARVSPTSLAAGFETGAVRLVSLEKGGVVRVTTCIVPADVKEVTAMSPALPQVIKGDAEVDPAADSIVLMSTRTAQYAIHTDGASAGRNVSTAGAVSYAVDPTRPEDGIIIGVGRGYVGRFTDHVAKVADVPLARITAIDVREGRAVVCGGTEMHVIAIG